MTATKRLSEVPQHRAGWKLIIDGKMMPTGTEWSVQSSFGSVQTAVVLDASGSPVFDRPIYSEAPNVNMVAYGRSSDGQTKVAVIRQPRPHADDPEVRHTHGHAPIVFGQVPMGFIEKILGESVEEAAERETFEETGARTVLSVTRPACPYHNPNPTFVRTWSDLVFVEVDLERIESLRSTRDEPIYSAEYIPVPELLRRIKDGRDEQGALYRMCTANSVWLIFFATFPELWQA
jgi:ADP-ribose pyrophosphatase YjhB (NUDIX family)